MTLLGPAFCPNATVWRSSCKRRTCPFCGPRWARDWRKVMEANLRSYGGDVVLISITAPGQDRLPWDVDHCAHRHTSPAPTHSGKKGCRVVQRAAREWAETASMRWGMLRQAAMVHTRRHAGMPATLLERVWEPQRRGVPHLHLVLGVGTPRERHAAWVFVHKLHELLADYDFGSVDRKALRRSMSGAEAARYLASYLTGRSRHKPTIRQSLDDPAMRAMLELGRVERRAGSPKMSLPLVWMTPKLTGATYVTMRTLRRARHLWAAAKGMCSPPKWTGMVEGLKVGTVYRTLYLRRGPPVITPDDLEAAKEWDASMRWTDREEFGMWAVKYALSGGRAPAQAVAA